MRKSIIIIGAGSNLRLGVADRCGTEGWQVGLINRIHSKLEDLKKTTLCKRNSNI